MTCPAASLPAAIPSGKPNFDDKDDINVFYEPERNVFVDMQITKQNWTLKYCDNLKGCDHRRVISARNSTDGVVWSDDLGLAVPDDKDPPEVSVCMYTLAERGGLGACACMCVALGVQSYVRSRSPTRYDLLICIQLQFYRIRPFHVGASRRLMAHVLLYAPGPWLGPKYGRQPPNCDKDNPHNCHAPHMYSEYVAVGQGANDGDCLRLTKFSVVAIAHPFARSP